MRIIEIRNCQECPFHDVYHYKDYCIKAYKYITSMPEIPIFCPLKEIDDDI